MPACSLSFYLCVSHSPFSHSFPPPSAELVLFCSVEFPQIFHLFQRYLGKATWKKNNANFLFRFHNSRCASFVSQCFLFFLQSRVSTVILVVPPIPGNSDQGKQCLFLVRQTHFLCHELTFVFSSPKNQVQ